MPTAADPVTEAARVDAVSRKRTLKPMRTARVVSNNEVCADRFAACASIEVLLPWMRSPRKSDTSFGGDGTVLTRFGAREDTWAMDVAQQPDGKIVAAGSTGDEFALVRYREADGSTRRLATTEGSERTSTAVSTKPARSRSRRTVGSSSPASSHRPSLGVIRTSGSPVTEPTASSTAPSAATESRERDLGPTTRTTETTSRFRQTGASSSSAR